MGKAGREAKALQRRRLRAARLLQRGIAQAEVARRVGVTRTTASQWNAQLQAGGLEALKSRPRGRPRGLEDVQRRELMRALTGGALAEGFATDLWTLPRVGKLIERQFGRAYSESQVWRILVSLGFSCQRPSGRALERNESAIQRWKQTRWPALKKTPQNKAGSSSSSTSRD
jgi:transposase